MGRYFASVQFVIEAESEADAAEAQQVICRLVSGQGSVIAAHADEPVEFDEFGHAG